MAGPRILFLDAHDSFSNNIIALLSTLLHAHVAVLPIDTPLLDPTSGSFTAELARYDAVVCGPGPGSPHCDSDIGLMRHVWELADHELVPVLGVCLGFQSLVRACGGAVRRLRRGMHGMVRPIMHAANDVFDGVGDFRATLYHSLGADVGQDAIPAGEWDGPEGDAKWAARGDLVPLAWVDEEREDGDRERILMAVRHCTKPFWGLQYHPESVCTEEAGNRVIANWFAAAQRWNQERGRVAVRDGQRVAGAPTKPSLLSRLSAGAAASGERCPEQWWETLGTDPALRSVTVPLPRGMQVPDVVEAVGQAGGESIILDSANAAAAAEARGDVRGRYSIIAAGLEEAPRVEHHAGDDYATVKVKSVGGSAVDMSQQVPLASHAGIWGFVAGFHEARHVESSGAATSSPFIGGFMGYITYEQGLHEIGVPLAHQRAHHRPDVCLAWVTKSLVVDHLLGVIQIQHLYSPGNEQDTWVERTAARLFSPSAAATTRKTGTYPAPPVRARRPSRSTSVQTPLTREYETKVSVCQEYIAAGDSYELCLTDQTHITRPRSDSVASCATSWSLFKTLRTRQPAPFASYLRLGAATLVSASPERFLQYDAVGHCSMRPMKGTVRKSEAVATLADAERILHVPKEEAENLMIVDLVRHDLHAVCGPGRVHVPHLLKVEEYQSVFQMITVVEGHLPQRDCHYGGNSSGSKYTGLDVLAASLPPGSMTGAPKRRSCEILQQIEGSQERSLYSGVVGYMCATGRGDWSVTIRSLFRWDDEQVRAVEPFPSSSSQGKREEVEEKEVWHIGAGGAVTILSTPDGERDEMFTKLAGPLRVFAEA